MSTKNVKANTTAKKSTGAEKTTTKKAATTAETTAKATEPKQNVKGMLTTLKSLVEKITDKKLKAEVQNSLKIKNPKAEDVAALLKRVIDSGKPAVVENEVKAKKPTIKKTEKAETAKTTAKAKKTTEKTPDKKENSPKSVKTTGDFLPPFATIFPKEIATEIEGEKKTLKLVGDTEFTKIEDFVEATEEGKVIIIACYWTPRHIKEFNYALTYGVESVPKKFEGDLDLAQGVTFSEKNKKFYAMSNYTEAMYSFFEEDFTPIEDTNPYNGEKYNVRVSNGMEFAVYVAE